MSLWLLRADHRDDSLLCIVPTANSDVHAGAYERARTIGAHEQTPSQGRAVVELHMRIRVTHFKVGDSTAAIGLDVVAVCDTLPKRCLHGIVFHNVGETGLTEVGAVEVNDALPLGVPDVHALNRTGTSRRYARPSVYSFEDRPRTRGDGANAKPVVATGHGRRSAMFHYSDAQVLASQRTGKRRANHTAPHD